LLVALMIWSEATPTASDATAVNVIGTIL